MILLWIGPRVVKSLTTVEGWHSARSFTLGMVEGIQNGQGALVHLVNLQSRNN